MVSKIRLVLLNRLFRDKNERSIRVFKNIVASLFLKFGSILIGLMLIPMTIDYINPIQYGLWLTISSIVSWMSFFDIGMGNGLRNKLAHAMATGDSKDAKKYVSTTYAVLLIMSGLLFLIFIIASPLVDWRGFLNVPSSVNDNFHSIVLIVFSSFCIQFVIQTVNTVLTAIHRPSSASLISFLGQFGVLITIFFLKNSIPGSLTVLVLALTLVPLSILFVSSLFFYSTSLRFLSPSIRNVDFAYARSILNLGGVFFFIQIGALVLFQTNNIIISRVIGPEAVTEYNVAYKLFNVLTMVFTIIMTPYWSAFTDAYSKRDFKWLKSTLKRVRQMWVVLACVCVPILVLMSKYIFQVWIGKNVSISPLLSVTMGLYIIGYTAVMVNCYFLNGLGKLRIQLILYVIVCLVNIPMCIYFGKLWGTPGIAISNIISMGVMSIILWIQSSKLVNQTARGIWRL